MKNIAAKSLAISVYERIKGEIFDFGLLPGDRFTETEVAARVGVSRTPVREALYRLQREGYIDVSARTGWSVKPFDFGLFEDLYDVRIVLELAATRKLCEMNTHPGLTELANVWRVPEHERIRDAQTLCEMDEAFHQTLLIAAGNSEMARIHRDISEHIRIIRRLDFTQQARIDSTYDEHGEILRTILQCKTDDSARLLRTHIEASKSVVRQITLHRLHSARTVLDAQGAERLIA